MLEQQRESYQKVEVSLQAMVLPSQVFRKVKTFMVRSLGNSKRPKSSLWPTWGIPPGTHAQEFMEGEGGWDLDETGRRPQWLSWEADWNWECESSSSDLSGEDGSKWYVGHTHSSSPQTSGHMFSKSQTLLAQDSETKQVLFWAAYPHPIISVRTQGLEKSDSATKFL